MKTLFLVLIVLNLFSSQTWAEEAIPARAEQIAAELLEKDGQKVLSGFAFSMLGQDERKAVLEQVNIEIRQAAEQAVHLELADSIANRDRSTVSTNGDQSTLVKSGAYADTKFALARIFLRLTKNSQDSDAEQAAKVRKFLADFDLLAQRYHLTDMSATNASQRIDLISVAFKETYIQAMSAKGRGDDLSAKEFAVAAFRIIEEGYLEIATNQGDTHSKASAALTQSKFLVFAGLIPMLAAMPLQSQSLFGLSAAVAATGMAFTIINDYRLRSANGPQVPKWPKFLTKGRDQKLLAERLMQQLVATIQTFSIHHAVRDPKNGVDSGSKEFWKDTALERNFELVIDHLSKLSGLTVAQMANYKMTGRLQTISCRSFYNGHGKN